MMPMPMVLASPPSTICSSFIRLMPKAIWASLMFGLSAWMSLLAGAGIAFEIALPAFQRSLDEAADDVRMFGNELGGRDHGGAVGRIAVIGEQDRSSTGTPFCMAWNGSDDG